MNVGRYTTFNDPEYLALGDFCSDFDVAKCDFSELVIDRVPECSGRRLESIVSGKVFCFGMACVVDIREVGCGRGAAFFDPNYGWFWFEEKSMCSLFFQAFYRNSCQERLTVFDRFYEIVPCKKVGVYRLFHVRVKDF